MAEKSTEPKVFRYSSIDKAAQWGGERAKRAFQITKGLDVGAWADRVLQQWPKEQMLHAGPLVLGLDNDVPEPYGPSYVIAWCYPQFTFIIAKGFNRIPRVEVYAVQEVLFNDEELRIAQEDYHAKWAGIIDEAARNVQRKLARDKYTRFVK